MTEFGKQARQYARQLSYTEFDAKEIATSKAETVGNVIATNCEEPRLDEICSLLDLDTSNLDNPAVKVSPADVALAAWSNWGAGSIHRAARKSNLSEGEFIVLNDYFSDIESLNGE